MNTVEIVGVILGSSAGGSVATAVITKILGRKTDETKLQLIVEKVYKGAISTMQEKIDFMQIEINTLRAAVVEYRKQEIEWQVKRKSLINQIKRLERVNNELAKQIDELTTDNLEYKRIQDEMHKQIEDLNRQLKELLQ